jgi:hypothetical protein
MCWDGPLIAVVGLDNVPHIHSPGLNRSRHGRKS